MLARATTSDENTAGMNKSARVGPQLSLIEAMMEPEFYPHLCEQVELRETLMSWLLFAGEFVYKVKKPVSFSFCDAATPAKRYRLCQDEVRLNRRLARDVYLSISGITVEKGKYTLINDAAETKRGIQEFAVVMQRLPSHWMLDQMVTNRSATLSDIQELAKRLVGFHTAAPIAKAKTWGSAQAIMRLITSNLEEAHQVAADSLTRDILAAVERYARRYLITHQQSFDNRARDGRVREGHGDLRCESICFGDKGLAILDCVESDEGLRYGDVASELASLTVDFDLLGRPDLAHELMETYAAESKDPQLFEFRHFYQCYRAVQRGRLEMLASLQTELPLTQRLVARSNAKRLFSLAQGYAGTRYIS